MAGALRTGEGLTGTIEFFPEEGKYHLDGRRKCGVRLNPRDTDGHDASPPHAECPECGKPLTVGVLHRVAELADRPAGYRPPGAAGFTSLVPLPEVVGEIIAVSAKSKKVTAEVSRLVAGSVRKSRSSARSRSTSSPRLAGACWARRSPGSAAARCSGTPDTTASTA